MYIHEYQAKEILSSYGLLVPPFRVIKTPEEAAFAVDELGLEEVVIKAQVHAGGRGKAGGVKRVLKEKVFATAQELIGKKIINEQTGKQGLICQKLMVTAPISIEKEFYLCVTIDRKKGIPILIASPEGGMDIEEVSIRSPEKVLVIPIELDGTIRPYHFLRLSRCMGWQGNVQVMGEKVASSIAQMFLQIEAQLIEINPLALSEEKLWVLDAKVNLDEDALFRHEDLALLEDLSQVPNLEAQAKKAGLSYIAMEGDIGCMVNGAGLAMATMDLIYQKGGSPANFLDVGGSASKEKVAAGFRILLKAKDIQVILVNIFGGILDCFTLAEGLLFVAKEESISIPLVIRMEGRNADQARELLRHSELPIMIATTLEEAAQKTIQVSKEKQMYGHSHR